ncbi:MAG: periplasmic heavy metal sensor [Chlorobium sp.]
MKKTMMMVLTATMLGIGSIASAATDYSRYSDTQLGGLRAKIQKASSEEQIAYRHEWHKRLAELGPDKGEYSFRSSEGDRKGRHGGINRWKEKLGLNESQSAKLKELREKQFSLVVAERKELVSLNRQLHDESFKESPDKNKIDELSEKIGKKHAALARLKSSHLSELASILTPAQRDKMQTIRDARELRGHYGRRLE